MELEEAIRYIHENPQVYLTPTGKKGGGYICPICGSGSGPHKTGIISDKTETWKFTCFAGDCFRKSDIINIIGLKEKLDNKEALFRAFEIYGIELKKSVQSPQKQVEPQKRGEKMEETEALEKIEEARIIEDIKLAEENLWQAEDYLRSRGISLKTAMKAKCGCIMNWYHPKVREKYGMKPPFEGSPRLIIPTGEKNYAAVDMRAIEEISQEERQWRKQKAGEAKIFNIEVLEKAESPIFIVEGEFDALSIEEIGYEAIALGSTSMVERFVSNLDEMGTKPKYPFVISLDNDEAGQRATEKLLSILRESDYEAYIANISGKYKDANEALTKDKTFFIKKLSEVAANPKIESLTKERNEGSNMGKVESLLSMMRTSRKPISTGFKKLDTSLDGGLYAPGLYIIAGGTSVGKTALMQQIAYNLAASKQDIIYFSLEMSIQDLFYRDLSRLSYLNGEGQSVHEIIQTQGAKITEKIISDYKSAASHIFTHAALSEITVEYIEKTATNHVKRLEEKPVLFVDYLQILEPTNPRGTDKQIVDHSIKSLNILSRSLEIPIVVAASLNRSGYSEEVTFQALKESGALEYTGDIVIGLQFQATAKISENSKNVAERSKKLAEERNKPIRKMEAVILKHRNGKIGSKTFFDYIPKYNIYKEGLPDKNSLDSLQLSLLQDAISKPDELTNLPVITKRTLK